NDFVPICLILIKCWPRCGHAGVVDEDFDRTKACFCPVQRALDAGCRGDVHHDTMGLAIHGSNVIDGLGKRFDAARSHRHPCTMRCEEYREKAPKTARTTGNKNVLADECKRVIHRTPLANMTTTASSHLVPDENRTANRSIHIAHYRFAHN